MQLDYFGRVHLALALGFSADLKKPLIVLGKMRNDFAHQLDMTINSSVINNFYSSFSLGHRDNMIRVAKETNQSWFVEGLSWKKVPAESKFVFMCIELYYSCLESVGRQKYEKTSNQLGRIALRQALEESK